jgi:hypothetical protein
VGCEGAVQVDPWRLLMRCNLPAVYFKISVSHNARNTHIESVSVRLRRHTAEA